MENKKEIYYNWIVDWIDRMMEIKNASVVIEKNGKEWDWGQAIARDTLGLKWNSSPEIDDPELETLELAIKKAKEWEKGNEPTWVEGYR